MIIKIARGRPQSQEKREAILKAATDLFLQNGFAASMDDIAGKAGVSKQTLYGHFANKAELYRAIGRSWEKPYTQNFERSVDLKATLVLVARDHLRYILAEDKVAIHRRLIEQASLFPDLAQVHDEIGPRHVLALFADFFEGQMKKGAMRESDAFEAAEDFLSLVQGQMRMRRLFGSAGAPTRDDIEKRATRAVEVFLRAYGTGQED